MFMGEVRMECNQITMLYLNFINTQPLEWQEEVCYLETFFLNLTN